MARTKKQNNEVSKLASALRGSIARLMRRLRLERPEKALSLFKLSILGMLYRSGPVTATDLAIRERIRPQSLTRLLANLEEQGLVSKEEDTADRRRLLIVITPEGKKALIASVRQQEAWLAAEMTRRLSPAERELLLDASRLLDRLTEGG